MLIRVRDYYDGIERVYKGESIIEAKEAIKRQIDDTSGECYLAISVKCKSCDCDNCVNICCEDIETELSNYADHYIEEIMASL